MNFIALIIALIFMFLFVYLAYAMFIITVEDCARLLVKIDDHIRQ